MMLISVVIPAFNEEDYLGQTLASLDRAKAFLPKSENISVQTIVVDNNSLDSTRENCCCRKPRLPSKTMTIKFSRNLAIFIGVLTPLAETVRRWDQLGQLSIWPVWLDDFVLGAFLLYGAWRTTKDQRSGQLFLASAWAFTCGMAYPSLLSQLEHLNRPDPAPIASEWVAVIKGAGLALSILALIASLRRLPEAST